MGVRQMTRDLQKDTSRVELKANTNKTKAFHLTSHQSSYMHNGQDIEEVGQFVYYDSIVATAL